MTFTILRNMVAALERKIAEIDPKFLKVFDSANMLSQVDPHLARIMVTMGDRKKDKVSVSQKSMKAGVLKPSQTSMVLSLSIDIAIDMLEKGQVGGDLGAVISKDGFIMDGHHRWSAAILAGGAGTEVTGYVAGLKGPDLIRVLNILTKGHFGIAQGPAGKGSIKEYTPANVRKELNRLLQGGSSGKFPKTGGQIEVILANSFGSVKGGVDAISQNAKDMNTTTPSWAPDRADMPVINKKVTFEAVNMLANGEVVIPPRHR